MVVTVATACTSSPADPSGSPSPTDADTSAVVLGVSDGDTISVHTHVNDLTIRLLGVNAPDRGECFADESRDYLTEFLSRAEVTMETSGTDQFGRTLAHVFAGDVHVNLDLVEKGLALATTPDDDPYGPELVEAEETAYTKGVGLWSASACGGTRDLPGIEFVEAMSNVNPDGPDQDVLGDETVTIINTGDDPIDLTGWTLRDESSRHRYTFTAGTISPGTTLSIDSVAPGWDPGGGPVWNNTGDMALLLDVNGNVVARWRY